MFTDNIGVELLAATPFQHKFGLKSTGTIAEVKQLPPSLMAKYYFGDNLDKLRPYLGVVSTTPPFTIQISTRLAAMRDCQT